MREKFKEYSAIDLARTNRDILASWTEEALFEQTLKAREGAPEYIFYEGPPSANGMPGIHHVIARAIKDIFCRYKSMQGFLVNRRAGWDTHGLPVELGVEKLLGITKDHIGKSVSIEEYNQTCRREVMKYTEEWEQLTRMMGYWVDMERPYITYTNKYIETLWYLLSELYKKGYLYKGYTIQPYSPAAGTGLSSHELNQPGCYRDVKDTVCTAQFKVLVPKEEWTHHGEVFFLAWTTTPWTLPSNTALAVGPTIDYVAVETFNPYNATPITVILGEDRLAAYFSPEQEMQDLPQELDEAKKEVPYRIIGRYKGSELAGMRYEQLIPWVTPEGDAFRVIVGDYVTTEDGTGIVHIAPTFGADDERVAKQNNIPPLIVIDADGQRRPLVDLKGKFYRIRELNPDFLRKQVNVPLYDTYAGRYVKNDYDPDNKESQKDSLDVDLCVMLKQQNRAFRIEKYTHNYPHCWRTDAPILYYPLDSWFIKSTAAKDQMIELNKQINWKPASTGSGRFGKWLENLQDWNLSRSRFWGTPLPIWRTEDGSEERCIGSVEQLREEAEKAVAAGLMPKNPLKDFVVGDNSEENYEKIDLHRPFVDQIVLCSSQGKPMYRESDLIDVWFDSGAMPFAQIHYPFENASLIEEGKEFPADFIAEGVDQTRGWFFTLHAIATMIRGSVAFRNVIANGLVLDKNGNKMSKRLGNAVDPFATIEKYGSDPLRWYMITNASPWENIKFDIEGVKESGRKFFATLYNTYQFFALYANLDLFDPKETPAPDETQRPQIDRWILSLLNSLIKEVEEDLNKYEPTKAYRAVEDFVVQHLSNWYVRLSRKRFWAGEMTEDKAAAYHTLYHCLYTVAKLIAPVAPFYADELFRDLTRDVRSVHLESFPQAKGTLINQELEAAMLWAQDCSSMVLALRRKVNLKVRQPLQTLMIPVSSALQEQRIREVQELVLSEVNVKEIKLADATEPIWVKQVKPLYKKLGPQYGAIMKPLAQEIEQLTPNQIAQLEQTGSLDLEVAGKPVQITVEEVEIIVQDIPGWLVANNGPHTVALDITVTPSLRKEGLAREFVNRIQNLGKQLGLDVTDHIEILVLEHASFTEALTEYRDYIARQVQADCIEQTTSVGDFEEIEIEDFTLAVQVRKS